MAEDLKAQIVIEAKDEASNVIRNMTSQMGALGGAFQRLAGIGGGAGLAIAAIGTALTAVVSIGAGVADQVEQLDLLASRTGVASENLQVLSRQITEMGGNSESLTQALSFLNRSIATGDPLLAQLGVTSKDTMTAFQQLAVAFGQSDDVAKKTEIGYRLLGRGAGELVALLPQLAAGFDQSKASMTAAGGILTGEVAEAARRLDEQVDRLLGRWKDSFTKIRASTVETALEVVSAMNDMWDAVYGVRKTPEEVERAIASVTAKIADLGKTAQAARMTGFTIVAAPLEAHIANMQLQLDKLKELRAEFDKTVTAPPPPTEKQKTGVADADLGGKKVEKTPREELIERITRVMTGSRTVAEAYVTKLDEIADLKFADSINEQLGFLSEIPIENLAEVSEEIQSMAELFNISEEEAAGMVARLKELGDERQRLAIQNQLEGERRENVQDVVTRWQDAMVEMQDLALVVDESFGQLFAGLEQGFNAAFQGILTQGQSFASAMEAMFRSLVNAIIAELARLAAVAVFKQILGFFTGGVPIANVIPGQGLGDLPLPTITTEAPAPTFATMPPIDLPPVEFTAPPPMELPPQNIVPPPPLELPPTQIVAPPPMELPPLDIRQPRPALAFERRDPEPGPVPVNVAVAPPVSEPINTEVAPPMGNTFNVYTYDAHTIVADLVSPGGKLRRAQDTVAVLGAY